MSQASLFDATDPGDDAQGLGTLDDMRDGRAVRRLVSLSGRLEAALDYTRRARLAIEIRDLAESLVESSLRNANAEGMTWRELGAVVGVPFQTLHRRYGG